jgi:hypothetical protein
MHAAPTNDRFAFGKNWQSFAAIADEESISEAQRGLIKLFPNGEIPGARVLDVGLWLRPINGRRFATRR